MSNFETAIAYVLENEGGFVDNPNDLGAATNFGISTALLSSYRGTGITLDDIKNLSLDEAKRIYKTCFWNKLDLDELPLVIATALLDMAVNLGERRAVLMAQTAYGEVAADGILGSISKDQLTAVNDASFLLKFVSLIQDYYCELVLANPKQIVFLKGWIRRAFRLMTLIHKGEENETI